LFFLAPMFVIGFDAFKRERKQGDDDNIKARLRMLGYLE